MAVYDDSERAVGESTFSLPALDALDDLPLPELAEGSRIESSEEPDLRDDFSELRDGVKGAASDEESEVASEVEDFDPVSEDASVDDEPEFSEPESIYDEVVEHPDYLNLPPEDEDEAPASDDLADSEALKAMFRAQEASGGELPDSFEVTKEPTPADLFNLDQVIADAIDEGASDIHISPDDYTAFSILGAIERKPQYGMLTGFITEGLQQNILTHVLEANFVERLELDTSYVLSETHHAGRRCRLSVGKTFGDIFMVFRVISDNIPSPEDLGVSEELREWSRLPNGLIMMNGPTGTGKSTTLASLLNSAIQERAQKIITIERPIEYVFGRDGKGFVTQREVGPDSREFSTALDSAMRQAPDIIMIGESRNRVEIDQVLRAAETGHLTFTTMHTNSAAATINRIKSLFEGSEQARVLSTLSDVARGFANQVLVPTVDGSSRFAIREVLPFTEEVSALVAEADVKGIRNFQIENHITMEDGLVKAVVDGRCTLEAAKSQSAYPHMFDQMIKDLG